MKIVHFNIKRPVKRIERSIIDLFTKEVLNLKAIHKRMTETQENNPQFTGFIA
jgi:hypothetical protein